jgi:dCMP deaminase
MPEKVSQYAVISLVPAIHSGYISFFKKYSGILYVIGKDFISDFPHIERDLRTPDFDELKKMLMTLGIFEDVIELTKENIKDIPQSLKIVMPDDEITKGIAEKYLVGRPVDFENIFLRWNRQISTTELVVPPDRVISFDEADRELIKQAYGTSEKSSDWWRQIGTLLVKDDKVIVTGFNCHLPTDFNMDSFGDPRSNFDAGIRFDLSTAIHSEARAVAEAARKGISTDEASLYVTTFPCPTCAKLVAVAGIKKVYYSTGYSLLDAENILKAFGIEIILVK